MTPPLVLAHPKTRKRIRLTIQGVVQGIGFRPFVYRLAHQHSLGGWIANTEQGAVLEIEGDMSEVETFQNHLKTQAPPTAKFQKISCTEIPEKGEKTFSIQLSRHDGQRQSIIPPDLATCEECLQEITDPLSRRYRYPFTTCTRCGPRYSIVLDLPYDRGNTAMAQFPLCDHCRREYDDMADRRFHAETMACPGCGPHVTLWDSQGIVLAEKENVFQNACDLVRQGGVLAVKGLGGFQLWIDASSEQAIQRLRLRKHRPMKPLAVLFPSLVSVRGDCWLLPEEEILLTSPEAPIVLLRKKEKASLAPAIAPNNSYVGAMLPTTPLHHVMMANLHLPVVATSGNRSEEPIVIDEHEALTRLKGIADAFLIHNRPIVRPIDDSVVQVANGDLMMLRRARGYAPIPLVVKTTGLEKKPLVPILGVGGHLKNTVSVTTHNQAIVSQHIGDLSTAEAYAQFERTVLDQLKLFRVNPQAIACDLHPEYRSTLFAQKLGEELNIPVIPVQHHHAHIAACMAEHGVEGPVLGVAWDGAGYGPDGTVWGGEFLICDYSNFKRVGHLRSFELPGGEICMREPRRVALSLLYEVFGNEVFQLDLPPLRSLGPDLSQSLVSLLEKNVHSPTTTSIGRLFDGVSSILGLCHHNTFEGEAAMDLEFQAEAASSTVDIEPYHLPLRKDEKGQVWVADWQPLVRDVVRDVLDGKNSAWIAQRFHQALIELVAAVAQRTKSAQVVLGGGVFQNAILLNRSRTILTKLGVKSFVPHQFCLNDGGLSLGQVAVAAHMVKADSEIKETL